MGRFLSPVTAVHAAHAIEALTRGRNGEIVVARVEAMLGIGIARLSINRQQIDVNTPVELIVGSEIRVALDSHQGALRLILQKDSQGAILQRPISEPTDGLGDGIGGPYLAARDRIGTIDMSEPNENIHRAVVAQAYSAESDQLPTNRVEHAITTDHLEASVTMPVANSVLSAATIAATYLSNGFLGIFKEPANAISADEQSGHNGDKDEIPAVCHCTSGKARYKLFDVRGVFRAYVCEDCEAAFKARFPVESFEALTKQPTILPDVV